MLKDWFSKLLLSLPENNKKNLLGNAKEKVGIFNPGLYSDRETT